MTVNEAIEYTDSVKPNGYASDIKLRWLNEAEGFVQSEIMEVNTSDIKKYTESDMSKKLLVPEPYSCLYSFYMMAMIDFMNGDFDKYENSTQAYNNALRSYAKLYVRKNGNG